MIQRLQSIYLLLTSLLSFLFLKGSFLSFINKTGSVLKITFSGILKGTGTQDFETARNVVPLTVLIVVIPVLALIAIFFYRNRILQLLLVRILIILISVFILLSAYYSYSVITDYGARIIPGIKMVLPFLMLAFSTLAFRGIRNDERLVKSYDRLR